MKFERTIKILKREGAMFFEMTVTFLLSLIVFFCLNKIDTASKDRDRYVGCMVNATSSNIETYNNLVANQDKFHFPKIKKSEILNNRNAQENIIIMNLVLKNKVDFEFIFDNSTLLIYSKEQSNECSKNNDSVSESYLVKENSFQIFLESMLKK